MPVASYLFSSDYNVALNKVIIDAGHGGKDPGNLGTGRYKYKENLVCNNQGVTWGNKSVLKKYKKILNFCFHAAKEFIKN